MCCTRLDENTGCKKLPKIRHLGTIAQICRVVSSQLRHVSTIRKKPALSSNISCTCPQNMADSGPLTAEIGSGVWGTPANLNGFPVLASLRAATSLTGGQPNFARCLAVSWAATLYTFSGALAPERNFARCKIHVMSKSCVSYIGSVTTPHSSSERQRNFAAWCKEWNYGTFAECVTDIRLGWAAMTLGIGPHSSWFTAK